MWPTLSVYRKWSSACVRVCVCVSGSKCYCRRHCNNNNHGHDHIPALLQVLLR